MSERPNIVLVVMDTARAKNFSCYGYERETTPFLDSLAEENVKYENAYSQANWTLPSHASIFSGKYISDHEIVNKEGFQELDLLMDELDEEYTKMSVTNVPFLSESFGFDESFERFYYNDEASFYGDIDAPKDKFRKDNFLLKYFAIISHLLKRKRFDKLVEGVKKVTDKWLLRGDSGAKETNEKVEEFLSDQGDEPFFMFLNYFEPHARYRPPFPYSHRFLDNKFRWLSVIKDSDEKMRQYLGTDLAPSEELLETKRSLYDGSLNYLDDRLRELYDRVIEDHPNTVFIFTSDHGEYFYEHENVNHVVGLHDEVTHVPMIEVFPNGKKGVVEEPVELRGLKDHIVQLSEGEFDTVDSSAQGAVSEFRGADESTFDVIERLSGETISQDIKDKLSRYRASIREQDFRLIEFEEGESVSIPSDVERKSVYGASSNLDELLDKDVDLGTKSDMSLEDEEEVKNNLEKLGYI